jgi:hypothetical protein
MAETKVINLEVKDNSEEAAKAFEKLSKAIDKTEKSANDLDATFEEVYGDLKPLTARMGEAEDRLYQMSLAGQQATQEYKDLLGAVGNYKRVQMQTDLVIDAAAQTLDQKLGGALQGATSAFAGVQGVMGLMGSESEELEKALLKVQSAMALAEGVKGVREALPAFSGLVTMIKGPLIKAFTTLKGAIITTGIGALVVALALVADSMGLFSDGTEDAAEAQSKLDADLKRTNESLERQKDNLNKLLSVQSDYTRQSLIDAKKRGASQDELTQIELQGSKDRLKTLQDELGNKRGLMLWFSKNGSNDQYEAATKSYQDASQAYKEQKFLIKEKEQELLDAKKDKLNEEKHLRVDKRKEIKDAESAIEKERIQNLLNLENEFLAELEKAETEYYDSKLTAEQLEIQNTQDKFFNLIEQAKQFNLDTTTLEQAQKDELARINNEYRQQEKEAQDAIDKAEKEAQEKKIADDKAVLDSKYKMTYDTINALMGLNDLFNAKNEKDARKQFKINKALSLAQASIQTFQAVTGALTAGGNPLKLATGAQFIEAGIAAAVGAANIAKIAGTQFEGGGSGGGGGGGSTPNLSTPQSVQPNFNIVGDSGVNQLDALKSQPSKVYVVSGEVSSAQALDRNRQRNATL